VAPIEESRRSVLRVRCGRGTNDRFHEQYDRLKRARGYRTTEDFVKELLDYAEKLGMPPRGFGVVG